MEKIKCQKVKYLDTRRLNVGPVEGLLKPLIGISMQDGMFLRKTLWKQLDIITNANTQESFGSGTGEDSTP